MVPNVSVCLQLEVLKKKKKKSSNKCIPSRHSPPFFFFFFDILHCDNQTISKMVGPEWVLLFIGTVFSLASGLVPLLFYIVFGDILNIFYYPTSESEKLGQLLQVTIKMLIIAVASGIAGFGSQVCGGRSMTVADVRSISPPKYLSSSHLNLSKFRYFSCPSGRFSRISWGLGPSQRWPKWK